VYCFFLISNDLFRIEWGYNWSCSLLGLGLGLLACYRLGLAFSPQYPRWRHLELPADLFISFPPWQPSYTSFCPIEPWEKLKVNSSDIFHIKKQSHCRKRLMVPSQGVMERAQTSHSLQCTNTMPAGSLVAVSCTVNPLSGEKPIERASSVLLSHHKHGRLTNPERPC
jgi:hypothetical protein